MHERHEPNHNKYPLDFKPVLLNLLDSESNTDSSHLSGLRKAELLYQIAFLPNENHIQELSSALDNERDLSVDELVMDILQESDEYRVEYLDALGDIIRDLEISSLDVKQNAIRLACTIEAWDVEESVGFLKRTLNILDSRERSKCESLINEIYTFYNMRYQANNQTLPTSQSDSSRHNSKTTVSSDPRLDVFREFIDTLDLSGFTGEKN